MPVAFSTPLRSLPDQIAEAIRTQILSGELTLDERLPTESELAESFNVSRPTIREALKRLAAKNLIRSKRGVSGGNFVSLPTDEQVRTDLRTTATLLVSHQIFTLTDVAESRRLLETECASLAAARRTQGDLEAMETFLRTQEQSGLSDEEFCEADVAFHRAVVHAAHNPVLDYVMVFALEAMHPSTNLIINRFRRREDVLVLQRRLLQAIHHQDATCARSTVAAQVDHLSAICEQAQASLATYSTPLVKATHGR